jgi:O-antigen/teichoic acid export membrane protein
MHQLVEYLLGVALLSQGLRTAEPLVPTVLGALVLVNVAVVDGPLSAFKAVSRRFHRGVDVVLVVAMVVAVLLVDSLTSSVQFMIVGSAAVMAVLIWRSDYRERVKRTPLSSGAGRSEEVGRLAGRAVGQGVQAWRRTRRS